MQENTLRKFCQKNILKMGTLKAPYPRDTCANVPLQDFTEKSDIDWSKSIEETDAQLYKKYNLSDEEIAFVESMIKPM